MEEDPNIAAVMEYADGVVCGCCEKIVPARDIDGLYGVCGLCSWCQSLGQCIDPNKPYRKHSSICCHGACRHRK